ncbi:carboxypeptidase regulatory-like domain-containing protein [Cohnella boryungensis]|uniref:Carboxypeptidase regulatory-like domain-containing protein n=1 Tax=Cohnella boryungensis TaxID=768479 RepID=A0ABV8S674_9BACL
MPFPSSSQFVPVTLGGAPLVDPPKDVSPSETDIVGTAAFPAAYYAYDGTNVYFRLRLNSDPRSRSVFKNFAWGVLFDTDGDASTYEWELVVNGLDNTVDLIRNTSKIPDSLKDQAEGTDGKGTPNLSLTICNFDIARAGETGDGSAIGSSPNYFLDWFIPAATLFQLLGIQASSALRLLFFTATNNNNFNKDFTGAGQTLSTAFSDPLTIDGGDCRAKLSVTQSLGDAAPVVIAGVQTTLRGTFNVANAGRSGASTLFVNAPFSFDKLISFTITQTTTGNAAFNLLTQTLTWNIGNLDAGAAASLQFQAVVLYTSVGTRTVDTKTTTGVDLFTGAALKVAGVATSVNVSAFGGIAGTTLDQITGLPLSGAAIQSVNSTTGATSSATTSASGVYSLADLPAGSYNVSFSFPNYQNASVQTAVASGAVATANVLLSPNPAVVQGTLNSAADGTPISGATVHLTNSLGVLSAQATTDPSGLYSLPGVFPSTYRISFDASGFQSVGQSVTLGAGQTRTLDASLQPNPGIVTGTVVSTAGGPVPGTLLEVLDNRNNVIATTTADANGNYTVSSLAPSLNYRLRISMAGFVTQIIGFKIAAGQTTIVNISLSPLAGILTGVVTDAVSEASLPGASVRILSTEGIVQQTAAAGADGSYTISTLSPGYYSVVFAASGYASATIGASVAAGAATVLNAGLQQLAGALSGVVTRTDGSPVGDAAIRALQNNVIVARVNTGEDGSYMLGNLAPGSYTLSARADGFGGQALGVVVFPAQTTEADFTLIPNPGSLGGRVTASSGNPIAGAAIALQLNLDGGSVALVRVITDNDGTYNLPNVTPLPFVVTVSATGFQNNYASVVIRSGQASTLDFVLNPSPGSLSGTISGTDGSPIAGASVQIRTDVNGIAVASVFADENGSFIVGNLSPETYSVVASADGFQTSSAAADVLPSGNTSVSLLLRPNPGTVLGLVLDAVTSVPIFRAIVTVTDRNNLVAGSALVDAQGNYQIDGLPPGNYSIVVTALNYQSGTFGAVVHPDASSPYNLALQPNPGTILGKVAPAVGGALVQLFNLNNVQISTSVTQNDGSFQFIGAEEGSYYAVASATGYSSRTIGIDVSPGETVSTIIELTPNPGSVAGTVRDTAGNPISGAFVKALNGSETLRGVVQADADGQYVISNLPIGSIQLLASATDFGNSVQGVLLNPGERVNGLDFALSPNPGSISGQVTDAITGLPIGNANVDIRTGDASGLVVASVTGSPFGNFVVDGLQPGTYTVSANADEYAASSTGAIVRSGQSVLGSVALTPSFGRIDGAVSGASGNPVSFSQTEIRILSRDGLLVDTPFVRLDGTFSLGNVSPGTYSVSVSAPGFVTSTLTVNVSPGLSSSADAVLQPEAAIVTGNVRNALNGQGITGVQINVSSVAGLPVETAFTDEKGGFTLTGVPIGNFTISASASRFGTDTAAIVTKPGRISTVELSLTPDPGEAFGFVSDQSSGANLAGAAVRIFDATTNMLIATVLSGNGGEYSFPGLAPGSYTVTCSADGYADELGGFAIFSGEATRYSFALDPLPGRLNGKVKRSDTNGPLQNCQVVVRQYNNFGPQLAAVQTDSKGNFDLGEIASSNYALTASLSGFSTRQDSTVVPPGVTVSIDFLLPPSPGSIAGSVSNGNGQTPLPDTPVTVVDGNGVVVGGGVTDSQGQYQVPSLPSGEQNVVAANPQSPPDIVFLPSPPPPGQPVNLIQRGAQRTIAGTVTDSVNLVPVPGAIVSVLDPSTNTIITTGVTDAEGRFEAEGLGAGPYTLTASSPGYGSAALLSGTGELRLSPAFGTLTGTIRDAAGQPLAQALAEIIEANGAMLVRQIISNAAGRYTLTNLAAGVVTARFSFPGKTTALRSPVILDQQVTVLDVVLLDEEEE